MNATLQRAADLLREYSQMLELINAIAPCRGEAERAEARLTELRGLVAKLERMAKAEQYPEPSEDMQSSALLFDAATDICMQTGESVSDFAKWLSDGGMLEMLNAFCEKKHAIAECVLSELRRKRDESTQTQEGGARAGDQNYGQNPSTGRGFD